MANNVPIIVPELILKSVLDAIIRSIHHDTLNTKKKEDTIIYRMFGDLSYGKYNYYKEATELFSQSNGKARKIITKQAYDGDISNMPTIFVTTGKDSFSLAGIGRVTGGYIEDKDGRASPAQSCRFSSESSFVIVSDSMEETVLIYNVVRAMLLSVIDTLSLSGIENTKLSGADIQLNEDLIPKGVFMRSLSIAYEYEIVIPSMTWSPENGGMIVLSNNINPIPLT